MIKRKLVTVVECVAFGMCALVWGEVGLSPFACRAESFETKREVLEAQGQRNEAPKQEHPAVQEKQSAGGTQESQKAAAAQRADDKGSKSAGPTETKYVATAESLRKHPLPEWYADAKLGIFIHWGSFGRGIPEEQSVCRVVPEHFAARGITDPEVSQAKLWSELRLLQFCGHVQSRDTTVESRCLGEGV
jgi:hypothetical protein